MMHTHCLKCNKPLKNKLSMKLGYGKTCYRIISLEKPISNKSNESNHIVKLQQTIDFLKCEINMIKLQLTSIKSNSNSNVPIERNKKELTRIEQEPNKNNMCNVLNELKELFNENTNVKHFLIHIELDKKRIDL